MYAISQKAYQQVQNETQNGEASSNSGDSSNTQDKKDDDVIDAEYTKE